MFRLSDAKKLLSSCRRFFDLSSRPIPNADFSTHSSETLRSFHSLVSPSTNRKSWSTCDGRFLFSYRVGPFWICIRSQIHWLTSGFSFRPSISYRHCDCHVWRLATASRVYCSRFKTRYRSSNGACSYFPRRRSDPTNTPPLPFTVIFGGRNWAFFSSPIAAEGRSKSEKSFFTLYAVR